MATRLWSRKKGPNWNSQNHGLRRSINPHAGRCRMCVFPNPKSCDRRALPTEGTSTCHRRDRLFRICRHCRAQVGEAPRHLKIARYVVLTKLASTDRSEPTAAATWAPASSGSNSCSRLQVEGPRSTSALGQKRTCALQKGMSALPPIATAKADMPQTVMSACTAANSLFDQFVGAGEKRWRPTVPIASASCTIEAGGGARKLGGSVMGVFGRAVPRAYSAAVRLNSIATSSACNTHNNRYRCRQSATWYNPQRTVPRNADS